MLGDQLVRFRKQSALNKCCSLNVFWKCELCCQRESAYPIYLRYSRASPFGSTKDRHLQF